MAETACVQLCVFVIFIGSAIGSPASPATANLIDASNSDSDKHGHSANEVLDYSGYSLYRQLMETKQAITEEVQDSLENVESEGFKIIKTAIRVVLKTAINSFIKGFLPHVERVRRDSREDERGYLNMAVYSIGALMGRQKCSDMLACRTGKFVQFKVPAAQLAVMVVESMVPDMIKKWFDVVKKSVIDRADTCEEEYVCSLDDD